MAKKQAFSTGAAGASAYAEQRDPLECSSWPKPEEGLRLMHAFLDIKQAEVLEAIVKSVEEQSSLRRVQGLGPVAPSKAGQCV